jgi:hypothetical protein
MSRAQCSKDTDCKGDRVCDAGSCVSPAQPPSPSPAAPGGADPSGAAAPANSGDPGQARAAEVPAAEPEVPAEQPREAPKLRRHSTGMFVSGIVMASMAPIALLVAAVANNEQTACERGLASLDFGDGSIDTYDGVDCSSYDGRIYGGLISGAVLAGVGIPLIIIGGKKEPVAATATITPWATPRAAGLGLRVEM